MTEWEQRYANVTRPGAPAKVLSENLFLLPDRGLALDLACGVGANALLLASLGMTVEAWDTSGVAIEKLKGFADDANLHLRVLKRDAAHIVEQPNHFDVIVISHFLQRSLCAAITTALAPGGLLFYQSFTRRRLPGIPGPSNPDYLLEDNELLVLFPDLMVRAYRESALCGDLTKGDRNRACLVAEKLVPVEGL